MEVFVLEFLNASANKDNILELEAIHLINFFHFTVKETKVQGTDRVCPKLHS